MVGAFKLFEVFAVLYLGGDEIPFYIQELTCQSFGVGVGAGQRSLGGGWTSRLEESRGTCPTCETTTLLVW